MSAVLAAVAAAVTAAATTYLFLRYSADQERIERSSVFSTPALAETIHGTLYKDQHCECCEAHAEYLRKSGFDLKIEAVKNLAEMSLEAGVPPGFQGCHITKIKGYVFEGHITSDIIKRLLAEHPKDVIGLSLPGMPSGVPGMEGPRDSPLVVYAIKKDGTTKTYATQ